MPDEWLNVCFASNMTGAYKFTQGSLRFLNTRSALIASLPKGKRPPTGFSWNAYGVSFDRQRWDFTSEWQRTVLNPLLTCDAYDQPVLKYDVLNRVEVHQKKGKGGLRARDPALYKMARDLERDGYAKIDASWNIAPLLTESLRASVSERLLKAGRNRGPRAATAPPLKIPEARMNSVIATHDLPEVHKDLLPRVLPRLTDLAQEYLGEDAELTWYSNSPVKGLRLPQKFPDIGGSYFSGMYHHDRCGHRLKAFIFLTPVTEQTHPTRVAVGSQNTQYWTYNDQTVSRLADDYVESNYHVRPMLGEIGEGFIFDTNSIHRATMVGEGGHRESLIFEFNPKAKSSFLKNSPCGNTTMG